MSTAERILLDRIRRRSAALQPEAAKRLLAAYDLIRRAVSDAELTRALNTPGLIDALVTEILDGETLDDAFADLRQMIDTSTIDGARDWAKHMPKSLQGTFDVLNPRVIDAVRALNRNVSNRLAVEVRETVVATAEAGLREGVGPRVIAKRIQGAIGLSPQQTKAVENFRTQLRTGDREALSRVLGRGQIRQPDGTSIVRQSHAGGQGLGKRDLATLDRILGTEPLSADRVERMTDQYRKRLLALNTEANARSIALDANRLAQRLSWEDAVSRGTVDRNRLRRTWLATGGPAGDGRNREEHLAMHGETVAWDERYSNGEQVPGESTYNCRCGERITLAPALRIAA